MASLFKNLPTLVDTRLYERRNDSPFPDDFILEMMIQQSMVFDLLPLLSSKLSRSPAKQKCEKKAAAEYNKGKRLMEKNQNTEALLAFNESVIMAPGSSKQAVSSYIARSVCLQKMKALPQSLEDINRALKLSLTENQKEELLSRKKIIETLITTMGLEKLKLREDSELTEELSYGENKEIVGVSSAMDLKYNEKFGRHYVANQEIKVGDTLMIQKPFVHSPFPDLFSTVSKKLTCDNCLESTVNPIPCEKCVLSIYCSDACKLEAFKKFHRTECEICQRFPVDSQLIPLRALLSVTNQGEKLQDLFNVKEKVDNCKDKRKCGFGTNGKLDGSKPEALLSLLTHTDKHKLTEIVVGSAIIVDLLRRNTDFLRGNNNYETVLKLAKLLLKISYCCTMNMYGVRGIDVNDKIALAMYPVFNYLNNSCSNNTFWYDKKGIKILRACKDIKKGEQICVSYLSTGVQNTTCAERKRFFENIKFFTCQCEACENNYEYKLELKGNLKVPSKLKKTLKNKPNDTESLWELLKLVHKECRGPSLEAKEIEIALANAHMGSKNELLPYTFIRLKLF